MLFGKLTERAQKVLAYAQEEAITLKNSNIGTEHLLLGLVKEHEGIAAKVLASFNIDETVSYTHLTLPTNREV